MPISHWFDEAKGCYRFEVVGAEQAAIGDAVLNMVQQPDYRPGVPAVWDMRQADLSEIDQGLSKQFGDILERTRSIRGSARVALNVDSDLAHGNSRKHLAFASVDYLQFGIFRDEDEAVSWATGDGSDGER